MNGKRPRIIVVASFMMDLTTKVKRIPLWGETVFGYDFQRGPGGKGSNAAVCAKRLEADVTLILKVGDDVFGKEAVENFEKEGFDTSYIYTDKYHLTGVAPIFVEDTGENIIAIVPGANSHLGPADIDGAEEEFKSADVLLTNFEIPLRTAMHALRKAKSYGLTTILNPAPAPSDPLDDELFRFVDILTPNETEAKGILGIPDKPVSKEEIAREFISKGVGSVIITLGERGAFYVMGNEQGHVDALHVKTIDATGAGGAFNGALAVSAGEGRSLAGSVALASRVAALSTTRFGTARAMPRRSEVIAE